MNEALIAQLEARVERLEALLAQFGLNEEFLEEHKNARLFYSFIYQREMQKRPPIYGLNMDTNAPTNPPASAPGDTTPPATLPRAPLLHQSVLDALAEKPE